MAQVEKVETTEYVFRMSEDEVLALRSVLAKVGGSPEETRRKHIDGIWGAIQSLGFFYDWADPYMTDDLSGTIHFEK